MSEKAERNMILDYTKCILSILIVFIHVQIPGNAGIFIDAIARIGVPFFFNL